MIQASRIQSLNRKPGRNGEYVLYWMQASQRAECNHALEFAIRSANEAGQPVVVYFGLTDRYPEANLRHFAFMLEGIRQVRGLLRSRGIQLVVRCESPETGAVRMAARASLLVCDCGYLRVQRQWRDHVAREAACHVVQVESELIVPVTEASEKEEYSARTLRPKITRRLPEFLVPLTQAEADIGSLDMAFDGVSLDNEQETNSRLRIDRTVSPVKGVRGGTSEARRRLRSFVKDRLSHYAEGRNDPTADCLSGMSPYLHFGQISPLEIALHVLESDCPDKEAYLEELVVRRELSANFVHYNQAYDSYEGIPSWARKTLEEHRRDRRAHAYELADLEQAVTHDSYWNAAQREMVYSGKMHAYMRMYWGKKLIEWSREPEEAYQVALHLNNKYELDGRDPNGYAGVAWCFGKHDRPWATRPVFGNVRSMTADGLRRKFDADRYAMMHAAP